ncbi:MAG: HAD hydrolase-like protein [Oscillospiraceae bacterium]|nr:HAD hydrolase-like protein [Oscillospiraceae bacterium]
MLRYKCLVLDHDDTVVQTEKAIGYPYFKEYIERVRPGHSLTYPEYVADCSNMIFADMCRRKWQFTDEELLEEYLGWKAYSLQHMPPIFPGIDRIIHRQKEEGGLVCVSSLSSRDNITRDYAEHFGMQPDVIYDYDLPQEQRKPNPYSLLDIMARYDLAPEEILVVDDLKLAWRMAHPLGVPVAFAAWGKQEFPELAEEMRSLCDFSFDTTEALEHFLFEEK